MEDVRGNSKVPEQEHRHGEGYSDRNKIPTVQRFNEEERQKREEAARLEKLAKKKGLSRVVRDPVTGRKVEVKDSHGDHAYESANMNITVPRRSVLAGSVSAEIQASEFNSEGAQLSDLQEDYIADSHVKFVDQFGDFLKRSGSLARSSKSGIGTATSSEGHQQIADDKQAQRQDNTQTSSHDEDG